MNHCGWKISLRLRSWLRCLQALSRHKRGLSVSVHTDIATHFVSQASGRERVFFDGETQKHGVNLRWGLSPKWELSAHLSSIKHDGGFVDAYVNRWHDFFGMSDGGRSTLPEDQIRFQFDGIEQESLLDRPVSGQSDSTLELSYVAERQQRCRLPTRSATKPLMVRQSNGSGVVLMTSMGLRASVVRIKGICPFIGTDSLVSLE